MKNSNKIIIERKMKKNENDNNNNNNNNKDAFFHRLYSSRTTASKNNEWLVHKKALEERKKKIKIEREKADSYLSSRSSNKYYNNRTSSRHLKIRKVNDVSYDVYGNKVLSSTTPSPTPNRTSPRFSKIATTNDESYSGGTIYGTKKKSSSANTLKKRLSLSSSKRRSSSKSSDSSFSFLDSSNTTSLNRTSARFSETRAANPHTSCGKEKLPSPNLYYVNRTSDRFSNKKDHTHSSKNGKIITSSLQRSKKKRPPRKNNPFEKLFRCDDHDINSYTSTTVDDEEDDMNDNVVVNIPKELFRCDDDNDENSCTSTTVDEDEEDDILYLSCNNDGLNSWIGKSWPWLMTIPSEEELDSTFRRIDKNAAGTISMIRLDAAIRLLYPNYFQVNSSPPIAFQAAYKSCCSTTTSTPPSEGKKNYANELVDKCEYAFFVHYLVYYHNLSHYFSSSSKITPDGFRKVVRDMAFLHFIQEKGIISDFFEMIDVYDEGVIQLEYICNYLAFHTALSISEYDNDDYPQLITDDWMNPAIIVVV